MTLRPRLQRLSLFFKTTRDACSGTPFCARRFCWTRPVRSRSDGTLWSASPLAWAVHGYRLRFLSPSPLGGGKNGVRSASNRYFRGQFAAQTVKFRIFESHIPVSLRHPTQVAVPALGGAAQNLVSLGNPPATRSVSRFRGFVVGGLTVVVIAAMCLGRSHLKLGIPAG